MFSSMITICLVLSFLFDITAAFYFYNRGQAQKKIMNQLYANQIKSFGVVIDKERIKQINSDFWKEYITIKYAPKKEIKGVSILESYSGNKKNGDVSKEYYIHKYQVNSSEFMNTNIGQEVPISYSPNNPAIIKVINTDGTMKEVPYNLISKVLFGLSLIPLYLFLELLMTGDSILKRLIEF